MQQVSNAAVHIVTWVSPPSGTSSCAWRTPTTGTTRPPAASSCWCVSRVHVLLPSRHSALVRTWCTMALAALLHGRYSGRYERDAAGAADQRMADAQGTSAEERHTNPMNQVLGSQHYLWLESQTDPGLARTVMVSTKLDTRIPQFARGQDVELFLHPPGRQLEPTMLGGSPFFTCSLSCAFFRSCNVPLGQAGAASCPARTGAGCLHQSWCDQFRIPVGTPTERTRMASLDCRSVPSGRVGSSADAIFASNEQFREAVTRQVCRVPARRQVSAFCGNCRQTPAPTRVLPVGVEAAALTGWAVWAFSAPTWPRSTVSVQAGGLCISIRTES